MTGYQEVITDPSYAGQIIVMTYPQIGNYGVAGSYGEKSFCAARGLVVRELSTFYSPGPERRSLESFMVENGLPGLTGVDTRALALRIRRRGVIVGVIGTAHDSDEALLDMARRSENARDRDLVSKVTGAAASMGANGRGRVAIVDFGIKDSMVRSIRRLGVEPDVFDADFAADDILGKDYHFVLLSNGPGDPTDVPGAVAEVGRLIGRLPILGVCLGHQVTALALGGRTYKLKFGHRGANQPVQCHRTNRVFITSQNHGYAVADDIEGIPGVVKTYSNANDKTLEGFLDERLGVECVQFHPEASPGPHDTSFIFSHFFERAKGWKNAQSS
jgi:carbamoyl-phosphate synthase small subunit